MEGSNQTVAMTPPVTPSSTNYFIFFILNEIFFKKELILVDWFNVKFKFKFLKIWILNLTSNLN